MIGANLTIVGTAGGVLEAKNPNDTVIFVNGGDDDKVREGGQSGDEGVEVVEGGNGGKSGGLVDRPDDEYVSDLMWRYLEDL